MEKKVVKEQPNGLAQLKMMVDDQVAGMDRVQASLAARF